MKNEFRKNKEKLNKHFKKRSKESILCRTYRKTMIAVITTVTTITIIIIVVIV